MYYAILKPNGKTSRQFTIRTSYTSVGKFVRQSSCPGRFAIVTIQMEPTQCDKASDGLVEVLWEVDLRRYSAETARTMFDGVVSGARNFTDASVDIDGRSPGALTCCTIKVLDAEWHHVDSSQLSYAIATSEAIKTCCTQAGIIHLKAGGGFFDLFK
ncbi:MAG: hypothetical protein K2W95_09215 [Candidatus Obscuribacterales bacterium]|nr:hypothetical protein [Candidatus Obscuribacterales bacterium]